MITDMNECVFICFRNTNIQQIPKQYCEFHSLYIIIINRKHIQTRGFTSL